MKPIFISISAKLDSLSLLRHRKEVINKLGLKHKGFGNYYDRKGQHYRFEKDTAKLVDQGKKEGQLKKDTIKEAASFLKTIKSSGVTPKGKQMGLDAAMFGFQHKGYEPTKRVHSFSGSSFQGKNLLGKAKKDGQKIIKHTDGKYYLLNDRNKPYASVEFKGGESHVSFV